MDYRLLINYLPHVVRDYDVFRGITDGEQPEFELAWDAEELAFSNQFIDTATEYGLSRWEAMLKIRPKATDTIESRRITIKAKLNTIVPYTIRALIQKLEAISNGLEFTVILMPGTYLLEIKTKWDQNGQVDAMKGVLEEMLPVNIAVDSQNEISCEPLLPLAVVSGLGFTEMISISDYGDEHISLEGELAVPAGMAITGIISVSEAGNEYFTLETTLAVPGGTILAENINLHD